MRINQPHSQHRIRSLSTLITLFVFVFLGCSQNAFGQWTTNGNDIYSTNSGNVAIGTSTPEVKFHLKIASTAQARIESTSAAAAALDFKNTSRRWVIGAGLLAGGGDFSIYDANAAVTRMYFDTSGNVGIGTTSPNAKLVVASGNVGLGTNDIEAWSDASSVIESSKTAIFFGQLTDLHLLSNAYHNAGWKYKSNGPAANYYAYNGDHVFRVAASGTADAAVTWTQAMTINNSGNVGIGTTSPNAKLVVASGNVGLGTNDIETWTHASSVIESSATAIFFGQSADLHMVSNAYHNNGWKYKSSGLAAHYYAYNGAHVFQVAPSGTADAAVTWTDAMTINNSGNVGIGTSSPNSLYRLDVQGLPINASGGLCMAGDCKTTWAQVGGSPAFSGLTAGTNTVALVVGSGGSLGVSGTGTINATTLGGASFAAPGAIGGTTRGSGAFSAVGINTAPSAYNLDVNGNTNVTGNITVAGTGNITAVGTIEAGNIKAKYQDVAEWVPSSEQLSAGTVVVVDQTKSNQVISSTVGYDTRVAGVISEQPGIALGEAGADKVLVATTGRVRVKVDATRGPIRIGDLLVTSDIEGVAMKSEPLSLGGVAIHRPGTLIGKALEPLEKGRGEILVLLSLQ